MRRHHRTRNHIAVRTPSGVGHVPSCARCGARPARYIFNHRTGNHVAIPCTRCAPGTSTRTDIDLDHITSDHDGFCTETREWKRTIRGTEYRYIIIRRSTGAWRIIVLNAQTGEEIRHHRAPGNRTDNPTRLESCKYHD
jgi:hypothetical protein